jgi:hypothetical protein
MRKSKISKTMCKKPVNQQPKAPEQVPSVTFINTFGYWAWWLFDCIMTIVGLVTPVGDEGSRSSGSKFFSAGGFRGKGYV